MAEPALEPHRTGAALRSAPVRLRYLEALAQRLARQSPRVQQVLQERLQRALATGEPPVHEGPGRRAAAEAAMAEPAATRADSPLARLNRELEARTSALAEQARRGGSAGLSEMRSVREFSDVWAHIHAEQQVAQALGQGPENAGPLHPHRLILRSLRLMKDLSPAYLRGFLSHAEALAWLEQAHARPRSPGTPARAGKGARPRAAGR